MTVRRHSLVFFFGVFAVLLVRGQGASEAPDAATLVREAFAYYRGRASEGTVRMTIHRPDWERTVTLKGWTEGETRSLFVVVAPPKDQGNATLKKGREMWTYNPKINRVIKLPPSMMSQSWLGSDFSNNDLAKSDTILEHYRHTLETVEEQDGHTVYTIRSDARPRAPVVWGFLRLKIREDRIFLEEAFYDEEGVLVKTLTAHEIEELDGKLYPRIWKMRKAETPDAYTLVENVELTWRDDLPDRLFTLANLRTPLR